MDDKAKILIGEPGCPESSTQHMKKALTTANITFEASDHNFHVASVTPSVNLICSIPKESLESFYSGQVYVGLKNLFPNHLTLFDWWWKSLMYCMMNLQLYTLIWFCSRMVEVIITSPFYLINVFY